MVQELLWRLLPEIAETMLLLNILIFPLLIFLVKNIRATKPIHKRMQHLPIVIYWMDFLSKKLPKKSFLYWKKKNWARCKSITSCAMQDLVVNAIGESPSL